jgi:hypothetical protein
VLRTLAVVAVLLLTTAPLAGCTGGAVALPVPRTLIGVDAHDGHLLQVGPEYFLYGTSYDCGFRLNDPASPWCGFRLYTSVDLVHWEDRGSVFDPAPWQARCGRGSFGCFRIDVVHNPVTGRYVLWFNDPSTSGGYQVMTSASPFGPWALAPAPVLARHAGEYGDEALLVVGARAWVAYTVIDGANHDIAFQALDAAWTGAVGEATELGEHLVEAPALIRSGSTYQLTYSDPACPYCSGTGTAVRQAASPLGPWSAPRSLSRTSCGGQPAFVEPIRYRGRAIELYSSDLWDHGDYNEAKARIYLAPLGTAATGGPAPLSCAGADPPPA